MTGINDSDGGDAARAMRLAALAEYKILDSPVEDGFDDITKIAALVCNAPMAAISLVDRERQWFKSQIGLDVCETPIGVSVCATAIQQVGDIFVVPDLAADPRFAANALVTGPPYLRFYAGARLATPDGIPIGMVCVLDDAPRPQGITETQASVLTSLARQTMAHLELRRVDAERDMVQRELSHRVKNVFALVGSLAGLSARKHPEAQAFALTFRERVDALSRAHDMLLEREARGVAIQGQTLQALLETLLSPFRDEERARWSVTGADVDVGPRVAESLVLFLHEMATNAAKYGALSASDGRVAIAISVRDNEVAVEWRENGGPRLSSAPVHTGFGTRLMERAVSALSGTIERDWRPEGLVATLRAPAVQFLP